MTNIKDFKYPCGWLFDSEVDIIDKLSVGNGSGPNLIKLPAITSGELTLYILFIYL